jgi:hypothetical protein
MEWHGLDSSGLGLGLLAGPCEYNHEHSDSKNVKFLNS